MADFPPRKDHHGDVVAKLEDLIDALYRNRERRIAIEARALHLRRELMAGKTMAEVVAAEHRPLVVEVVTQSLNDLAEAGKALQVAEACALHCDGMSDARIAELFGVSRQRVNALLQTGDCTRGEEDE